MFELSPKLLKPVPLMQVFSAASFFLGANFLSFHSFLALALFQYQPHEADDDIKIEALSQQYKNIDVMESATIILKFFYLCNIMPHNETGCFFWPLYTK